jgi:hypothetical protein
MKSTNDLIGRQFGQLTVVGLCEERYPVMKRAMWFCKCSCGNHVARENGHLKQSVNPTCHECIPKYTGIRHTTHGDAKDGVLTTLYRRWCGMKTRCLNPREPVYKWYGGKGIKICSEWREYKNFRSWALTHGFQDHLTIERKNSDGNYEPSNCEWITKSENSRRARLKKNASKFQQN